MINGLARVTDRLNGAGLRQLAEDIKAVVALQVFVGIPEDRAARQSDEISNAALCYIHTNGSPLRGIPKRPIIEPAIEAEPTKTRLQDTMAAAAMLALSGRTEDARKKLHRAGAIGRDAAKGWFTNPLNNWPPLKASTIRRKLMKLKGAKRQAALQALQSNSVQATRTISALYPRRGAAGRLLESRRITRTFNRVEASGTYRWNNEDINLSTPLIDTGALRASITYLVKGKDTIEEGQ